MKHDIQNLKDKWQEFKWWLKWHEGEILFSLIVVISVAMGYHITYLGE